ncbi:serine--tRNA ligase [Siculibacillus lacustris]|uniref:Serine--tRNA ligase n=1 Tax=Siculibacillus lacustris TaxID=1549641 RepID=A0A4Q9VQA9_9HYPH|nr:serine--tRNA ligase [Siculibacillus lacustris]TBW37996.1 serine--tRNA ligase [Siculibacillus lacustris]
MHDIKWIRDNGAAFDKGLADRNKPAMAEALIVLDEARRAQLTRLQELQAQANASAKAIGAAMGRKDTAEAERLKASVAAIKAEIQKGEADARDLETELTEVLAGIPNLPAADVPVGRDESDNVEVRRWGTPREFDFAPKQHFELGEALGQMDFETATKISGARFVLLKGQLARLERALAQFMLDLHTDTHGYTEVSPPFLVKSETAYGTGNLPKFAEDLFRTETGLWLIPTAEVPVTNIVRDEILTEAELPHRYTAWTPCFRSEAGSAGRDTRGMIRLHQFAKVELVSITTPEASEAEHERMTAAAEEVLKRLGLPFRTIALCTGDMGFASKKTYDLEVWLPGQNAYREISSCSNCGDFQGRRMNARYRPAEGKGTRFVHTLNGSGVAVGRCLVAVLENWQNADGSITVPDALRPYMGGLERIG